VAAAVVIGTALTTVATAQAAPEGPPLDVPAAALERSLDCPPDAFTSDAAPILLIPGTTLTAQENFFFTYEPAFRLRDRPYCALTLPNHAMSDIQVSAEYVVRALRTMADRSGERVKIVGFSQGGMIGRWALKYWPDTREDVDEVIGLDPSNHGTLDAYATCTPLTAGCAPALWQQQTGSRFLAALNSGPETYPGIDYTSISTPTDEIVVPNLPPAASSSLNTGEGRRANISTLDVCPVHVAEHLSMGSTDPVGYALVTDALDHDGPADPARIDRAVCTQLVHEGVDPVTGPTDFLAYSAGAVNQVLTYPHVAAEPALKPYATGSGDGGRSTDS